MSSVTVEQASRSITNTFSILSGLIIYLIYKMIRYDFSIEYMSILIITILSAIAVIKLKGVVDDYLRTSEVRLKGFNSMFLGQLIMGTLGFLVLYLFFYKGAYGTYEIFTSDSFSFKGQFWNLLFKLLILFVSFKLVIYTDHIQTAYAGLKAKTGEV